MLIIGFGATILLIRFIAIIYYTSWKPKPWLRRSIVETGFAITLVILAIFLLILLQCHALGHCAL